MFVTVIAIRAIKSGLESKQTSPEEEKIVEDNEKDLVDDINKLNNLYSKGILTKDEFEKAKKKILD